jgi:hypothetical protein
MGESKMKSCSLAVIVIGVMGIAPDVATANGMEAVSGAPAAHRSETSAKRPVPSAPEGLCDSHHPRVQEMSRAAKPVAPEGEYEDVPSDPIPLWRTLSEIEHAQRNDARIDIEALGDMTVKQSALCDQIEALWNCGKHDDAIRMLRGMDDAALGMGVSWLKPRAMKDRGMDAQIGAPREDGDFCVLDYDPDTGNMFAVIRWAEYWTVNISMDHGATWYETYSWNSTVGIIDVDAVTADDYLYVAYVAGNAQSEARIRRCAVATGAVDGGYGFHTAFTVTGEVVDIALESNADSYDNRIFYAAIADDHSLYWCYDVASDGTTFIDVSPAISNAASGLDMHWNEGASISPKRFWFVSYIGTDNRIYILGRDENNWHACHDFDYTYHKNRTAISAYGDTVFVAHHHTESWGTGIRYRVSYDAGANWDFGYITDPVNDSGDYFMPDITARGGAGSAVIYCRETGDNPDDMFFKQRTGYTPGAWEPAIAFNDHDVYTGSWQVINFLPPPPGKRDAPSAWSFGMIYNDLGIMWFDRLDFTLNSPCPWDTSPDSGDGTVGLGDLNGMLSNWGSCPSPPAACPWDFSGDGTIGLGDLNALLSNWGPCP